MQPAFSLGDAALDVAYLRRDVDQLLIELAAVLTDGGDHGLELGLRVGRVLLLGSCRFQFLLTLLQRIGGSCHALWRSSRVLRGGLRQARGDQDGSERRAIAPQQAPSVMNRSKLPHLHRAIVARRPRDLSAVIGVSRQNRRSPVKLLQKHHTYHLMWP